MSSGLTNRSNKRVGKFADVRIQARVAQCDTAQQLDAFVENVIVCLCFGLGKRLPGIRPREVFFDFLDVPLQFGSTVVEALPGGLAFRPHLNQE